MTQSSPGDIAVRTLRRTVLIVALVNFAYFFVEFGVAVSIGSVALLADSVDFLEDTAVNLLVFIALGWPLARRAVMGKVMALIILVPAGAAAWEAVRKFTDPEPPSVVPLVVTATGAMLVNLLCAVLLSRVRHDGGSLTTAAFVGARNDVAVNLAIIVMGLLTAWLSSGWPDLILGLIIIGLALWAAWEVWEVSEDERLAAKALAGEDFD